jgi:glycosyltransferase involved in cell wall biosynthesis
MYYPFVSIIIPAKNEENIIGACFCALLNIEYPKDRYEIILVDNGSVDNTINVAKKNNINYYVKPGMTISALRNFGANIAKGEIFAFVDADIVVSRKWLKNAIKHFIDNRVACTGCSPDIPIDSTWVERIWNLQIVGKKGERESDWLSSANLIIRKNAFFDVKGFNELMKTCEDVDICYRLRKKWKIIYDSSIEVEHFGDAKTLLKLFKKESWRGIGNISGLLNHGVMYNEIPSHCVTVFYFIFTILFPVFIVKQFYCYAVVILFISLIFPIIKSSIISNKIKTYKYFFQLFVVWLVYGFGRGWSLWRIIGFRLDRG